MHISKDLVQEEAHAVRVHFALVHLLVQAVFLLATLRLIIRVYPVAVIGGYSYPTAVVDGYCDPTAVTDQYFNPAAVVGGYSCQLQ